MTTQTEKLKNGRVCIGNEITFGKLDHTEKFQLCITEVSLPQDVCPVISSLLITKN